MIHFFMRWLLLPILALSGCANGGGSAYAGSCHIRRVAELPLIVANNFLFTPATIGGLDALLVVDTGAETTLLTPETVQLLALSHDPSRHSVLIGIAGTQTSESVVIPKLAIGGYVLRNKTADVSSLGAFRGLARPVAGLLGADVLAGHDVEIDVPGRRLTLYDVQDCDGLVPWRGQATSITASQGPHGLIYLPALVDGHEVRAQFDTGARSSLLTRRMAARVGVSADALALDPSRSGHGIGTAGIEFRRHRFSSVAIGGMIGHDVELNVADISLPHVEMLLGADWLTRRRVWIAYGRGRIFVYRPADQAAG
jgi:predicted aspartyl protease